MVAENTPTFKKPKRLSLQTRPTAQTQLQKPTLNVHNVSTKVCISEPTNINIKLNKGKGKQLLHEAYSRIELENIRKAITELSSSSFYLPEVQRQAKKLQFQQRAQLLQAKLFGNSSLPPKCQVAVR